MGLEAIVRVIQDQPLYSKIAWNPGFSSSWCLQINFWPGKRI